MNKHVEFLNLLAFLILIIFSIILLFSCVTYISNKAADRDYNFLHENGYNVSMVNEGKLYSKMCLLILDNDTIQPCIYKYKELIKQEEYKNYLL